MKIVESAIRYPVTVAVGALLLILFGSIAVFKLPIQLTPDIDRPVVNVTTVWAGASPVEMEQEIVEKQEEQLKNVEGLVRMTSESRDSFSTVALEFGVGDDVDTAILHVANALDQVPSYPDLVDKPIIAGTALDNSSAIAWFTLKPLEGNDTDISTYFDFAEDEIKARFERVNGVARSNVYGGRERELRVIVDPERMAAHGVTFKELAQALNSENLNRSGGSLDEGKRRYVVRTVGKFQSIKDIEDSVVALRDKAPVYVKDLAEVRLDFKKPTASVWNKGDRSIAINALRESGANVLETMKGLQKAMDELNGDLLPKNGLVLQQVYDETQYINGAISLVVQNLFLGGLLAIFVLLIFLRNARATAVIAVSIPLSLIGTFIAMSAFGRSFNVISLAGLAFAVGMVVDNAIVVLENIFRHIEMGKSPPQAAADGASEVWGAVLASTLTTAAVFLPVMFIEEEAGQLFRDIALAISAAVLLSLVVSLTVIPALAAKMLRPSSIKDKDKFIFDRIAPLKTVWLRLTGFGQHARARILAYLEWTLAGRKQQIIVVVGLTLLSLILSLVLAPNTAYLPTGNRNLVFGILLPPPGYNLAEVERIGKRLSAALEPYFVENVTPESNLKGPPIENFFFVSWGRSAFMGAISSEPENAAGLIPVIYGPLSKEPGLIPIVMQSSLFSRHGSAGNNIDIEISGPDIEHLIGLGKEVFGKVRETLPGAQARPIPSLDLGNPEIQITPNRERASELGLSTSEIGFAVDAMVDGVTVSEYRLHGDTIDLVITGKHQNEGGIQHHQELEDLRLMTPSGSTVTLGSIATIEMLSGPEQINHIERERSITISVQPDPGQPLGESIKAIEKNIVAPLIESGRIGPYEHIRIAGAADALSQALNSFQWNFLLALAITYLLMAALFENFLYPLIIMFSVPLAALGGFAGLRLVHFFVPSQGLDLLTMLGFVILVGTVVNNAILVVHQTLHGIKQGLETRPALVEAVKIRIRPIFMSTATSIFGMLPLILFPGSGSEIYRGLGSVVVGGLAVATVFTLFLIPSLFALTLNLRERYLGVTPKS